MRAVVFDAGLKIVKDYAVPQPDSGWARIRIKKAGICRTDLEILKGYMGFTGVLGHEFVGVVDACENDSLIGKRVVGEINAACGNCEWCRRSMGRHCPHRVTLGIDRLDGCMADYCILPVRNLLTLSEAIPDDRAVFTEPLAAACEILEQLQVETSQRVIVLGDGRLGILCAWVLSTASRDVTLLGRHLAKLEAARWRHLKLARDFAEIPHKADLVVDATGSGKGLEDALRLCKPRGRIVLKSTVSAPEKINLAPLVINEITLVGSRCGRFKDALKIMQDYPDMPLERLITARFPVERAQEAFDLALDGKALKVILEFEETGE